MSSPQTNGTGIHEPRAALVEALENSRARFMAAIESVPLPFVLYEDGGWRLQDILSHIASWEREGLAALQAHAEGHEYTIPGFESLQKYNSEAHARRKNLAAEQVRTEWGMVRRELQYALTGVDPDRLSATLPFPWGGKGSVVDLIEGLIGHEAYHQRTIEQRLANGESG